MYIFITYIKKKNQYIYFIFKNINIKRITDNDKKLKEQKEKKIYKNR